MFTITICVDQRNLWAARVAGSALAYSWRDVGQRFIFDARRMLSVVARLKEARVAFRVEHLSGEMTAH